MTQHPGAVVRYGDDPALYIRTSDGKWTKVHLGFEGHPSYSADGWMTNDSVMDEHIRLGAATVVYASEPARATGAAS